MTVAIAPSGQVNATRTGERRAMTLFDLHQIKHLVALGILERVIVPGASPRIRYRSTGRTMAECIVMRTLHR